MNLYPKRKAFDIEEQNSIQEVIKFYDQKDEDPPYNGYFQKRMEKFFCKLMGGGYCITCSSGSSAAFIALQALGLKGKIVSFSVINDSGPINSAIILNNKINTIDTEKNQYNVSIDSLKRSIDKNTKAVVIAHIGGVSSQISKISSFLKRKKILLIEDCSQAPDSKCNFCFKRCNNCKKNKIGTFGDISIFSTMYRKNIANAGSGGIVYTKSKKTYLKIIQYQDRGKKPFIKSIYQNDPGQADVVALNHNINEFSANICYTSLKKLKKINKQRFILLKYLEEFLKTNSQICSIKNLHNEMSPFFCPIQVDLKKLKVTKNEFAKFLQKKGVALLSEYNCVITLWKHSKKFMIDKNHKNALAFRNSSFNLFINEKFNYKIIKKIGHLIIEAEKKFINSF